MRIVLGGIVPGKNAPAKDGSPCLSSFIVEQQLEINLLGISEASPDP
jgi:hypothetical protein